MEQEHYMGIQEGEFIKLNYSGSYNGTIFQTTWREVAEENGIETEGDTFEPVVICVGHKQVVAGLDEALIGSEVGDRGEVTVSPEKGFGERNPDLLKSFNKKDFDKKVSVGMRVSIPKMGEGTIVDMIGNKVIVDFNLPLAGKELTYQYEIVEKIEDPTEQFSGLIELYTGRKLQISCNDDEVTVQLPPGIAYDTKWIRFKPFIIDETYEMIPAIKTIIFLERYEKP